MTSVTYFIDNKLGGVTSLNYNLVSQAPPGVKQIVIHIEQAEWKMSRANIMFPVDEEIYFRFEADENTYSTITRLYQLLPHEEGALVLNYENEMQAIDHYPVKQTTYQLVHDDWNLTLAKQYSHVSDVFICHNTLIYSELVNALPDRKKDIFYLPHGVKIPTACRQGISEQRPLKLVFLGRITPGKGIFDLPVISGLLRQKQIEIEWTCIGNGPELEALKQKWDPKDKVSFLSPASNEEVVSVCSEMDVFVLPTKFEGSPVSLLETMSVGLVPVITDLPGGITDIVNSEIGYRIPINDNEGFARAIETLYRDRPLLNRLSSNCRNKIISDYDIVRTGKAYHELFGRYREFYKVKEQRKIKIGATLDHPLIPSFLSKAIRKMAARVRSFRYQKMHVAITAF